MLDRLCLVAGAERAIRTPAWHFRGGDEPELFAKPDDRWEVNNVATRCPDVVEGLQEALRQYEGAISAGTVFGGAPAQRRVAQRVRVNPSRRCSSVAQPPLAVPRFVQPRAAAPHYRAPGTVGGVDRGRFSCIDRANDLESRHSMAGNRICPAAAFEGSLMSVILNTIPQIHQTPSS